MLNQINEIINISKYMSSNNYRNYNYYFQIFESYHVLHDFDDCINYLVQFIDDNKNKKGLLYIGWNWNILQKKCTFEQNENSAYPIYINFYNDDIHELYMYVSERDFNNSKIIININLKVLNLIDIEYWLAHEFLHIRQQFALSKRNILLSKKNIGDNIVINDIRLKRYEFKIKELLYYISPTEQQARLQSLYRFVLNNDYNEINQILIKANKYILIKEYKNFYNNLEELVEQNNPLIYKSILVLGYFLYKQNIIKQKLTLDFLNYKLQDFSSNDVKDTTLQILNTIHENIQKYQIQLIKVIKLALNDKNNKK